MAEHYLKMGLVFDTLSYGEDQILLNELDFLYREIGQQEIIFLGF